MTGRSSSADCRGTWRGSDNLREPVLSPPFAESDGQRDPLRPAAREGRKRERESRFRVSMAVRVEFPDDQLQECASPFEASPCVRHGAKAERKSSSSRHRSTWSYWLARAASSRE